MLFRAPFLPAFSPHLSPLFPLRAPCSLSHHFSPLHLPPFPPFLALGKLRFRYPSDLGTLSVLLIKQAIFLVRLKLRVWGSFPLPTFLRLGCGTCQKLPVRKFRQQRALFNFFGTFHGTLASIFVWMRFFCLQLEASCFRWSFFTLQLTILAF